MMWFLLFLIVFMISYNTGTARPMIDSDSSDVTNNGLHGYRDEEMRYKMPTVIKQGMIININGTLDTDAKMLKVALLDSDDGEQDCQITLDFNTNIINVNPGIEDFVTTTYNLSLEDGVQSTFLIRLIPQLSPFGEKMLAVYVEINDDGDSDQLICDINYDKIGYIEVQQGAEHIDELIFKFKENR